MFEIIPVLLPILVTIYLNYTLWRSNQKYIEERFPTTTVAKKHTRVSIVYAASAA